MGKNEFREWYLSKSMERIRYESEADFIYQWKKGNKGDFGVWI